MGQNEDAVDHLHHWNDPVGIIYRSNVHAPQSANPLSAMNSGGFGGSRGEPSLCFG